ncbi:2-C-methyl-D-erythritol 4-phosphate cytidylyltransferase [Neisseria sp. HSC-16F19]|nr:2-C-methyl-D-erythritol 4-phosphate cytidylyltransferase [Neisseria sp. HSC-16F19]MCP2041764.1 2-C-methyl-D-erythritol 4-phosphate cytidylyltransferase [Neisseria sp. HSC-16F19]
MSRLIALVPAAGVGSRFGSSSPKQYTNIAGCTVLEHSVTRLAAHAHIAAVAVVVSPQDAYIDEIYPPERLPEKLHILRCGGDSRADSVANGLDALLNTGLVQAEDRILVHDAARCCLPADALQRLIDEAAAHPVGGILALPVADTLKRSNGTQHIDATVARAGLWQAQTPQLFPAALLQRALHSGGRDHITDEASAIEQLGLQPLLVLGDSRNLKMTLPQDAYIVRLLLQAE